MNTLNTKEDYQNLLLQLLEPLKEKFSPQGAGISLYGAGASYPENIIAMEAFARPLWGLVPFWAGGGRDEFWEKTYQKGLLAGTDPKNPEYWGKCEDYDQKLVEMAAIAFAILFAGEKIWEPLTEKEKKVITLYYYEDLTLKEISNVLGVSESRISQLHTRALQKMRGRMGNYMGILGDR